MSIPFKHSTYLQFGRVNVTRWHNHSTKLRHDSKLSINRIILQGLVDHIGVAGPETHSVLWATTALFLTEGLRCVILFLNSCQPLNLQDRGEFFNWRFILEETK